MTKRASQCKDQGFFATVNDADVIGYLLAGPQGAQSGQAESWSEGQKQGLGRKGWGAHMLPASGIPVSEPPKKKLWWGLRESRERERHVA